MGKQAWLNQIQIRKGLCGKMIGRHRKGKAKSGRKPAGITQQKANAVKDFNILDDMCAQIHVRGGTIFRPLRGGLGLRPAGILEPVVRSLKGFWESIKTAIPTDCNVELITSEQSDRLI